MKIFISYAHVNLPRVQQLADFLRMGGHDVWFDQRLVGGQPWKEQLRSQINTSQCFLYALTPESVGSAWCQWEFAQAVHMGKKIVTVLLQTCKLNGVLKDHQYIDFTQGDSFEAGLRLGTAVFAAQSIPPEQVPLLPTPDDQPPEREIAHTPPGDKATTQRLYDEAFQAYRQQKYAEALDLLHDCLMLDDQHVEARKLKTVVEKRLVETQNQKPAASITQPLHSRTLDLLPQPFAWIEIPAGKVIVETFGEAHVPAFYIAKYPLTNAQYAKFIEAGGYRDKQWWTTAGWQALKEGRTRWNSNTGEWETNGKAWTEPDCWKDKQWNRAEQPVVGVSWYEALAFCRWLSAVSGEEIMLPTEQQWQRAAQGDDGRVYPWGNNWGENRCSHSVGSKKRDRTMSVRHYESKGDSPFGVVDMAGNVWEWCLTARESGSTSSDGTDVRVLRGGSWDSSELGWFHVTFRGGWYPHNGGVDRGFRCVRSR
jgi:hypothetical protein